MQLTIDPRRDPIRLLQITDCHLDSQAGDNLLGLNTEESLLDVVAHMKREQDAGDCLLVSGDITGHGEVAAYRRFLSLLQAETTLPIGCLPGNHDLPAVMNNTLPAPLLPKTVLLGNWLLILLDSTVEGEEYGDLSPQELNFLQQTLASHRHYHTLIFLHHQLVPVGSAWIDQYVVRSCDKFFAITDQYSQIKGISWGHMHQEFEQLRRGVPLWATPSTCVQFKPNCQDFTVDRLMPGYRWYDLYADGRCFSQISRIDPKFYPIDYASSGY